MTDSERKLRMYQIVQIKRQNALDVHAVIRRLSKPGREIYAPLARSKNYKSKMIVCVSCRQEAEDLISEVRKCTRSASQVIHDLITQKKDAIQYQINMISIEDPTVKLSVRQAEQVWRKPGKEIISFLEDMTRREISHGQDSEEVISAICFSGLVKNADLVGRINLQTNREFRLARDSGRSFRIQTFTDGRWRQRNVGDLCILVAEDLRCYDHFVVQDAPVRKKRSDAHPYQVVLSHKGWSLAEYS